MCVDLASRDVKLSFQSRCALSPRGDGGAEGERMRLWRVGESIIFWKRDTCEAKPISLENGACAPQEQKAFKHMSY